MTFCKKTFNLFILIMLAAFIAGTLSVSAMEKININTAPVEQLVQLDRIGAIYADRIVEYRETYGPFNNPEDIMNVKGIGEKTWEANKDRIVVQL